MAGLKKSFQYGEFTVTFETGQIARQADGAVLVHMGDTTVLVTVVAVKDSDPSKDFFPLTVNYQERTYAAGRVPGGYFRREGRPSEKEILTSRLIDRPIRPLFPKGFKNEVQIIATVLSHDPNVDADIPSLLGASAALSIAGVPFQGPVGAARVGYCDGVFLLNPSSKETKESKLDLVVAGTERGVLMVESEADELSEEIMESAYMFGHEQMQVAINAIKELAQEVNKPMMEWVAPVANDALVDAVANAAKNDVIAAYQVRDKLARKDRLAEVRDQVIEQLADDEDENKPNANEVANILSDLEKRVVRDSLLAGNARIDGRDTKTVRPINIEVGVLPRTHGSAIFTRGETQAIVVTTLGTGRDAQTIDALEGESIENFMLHYNFPPYCVGETGMIGSPKRREIGHGKLAKRAIQAMLPSQEEFQYVLRVVSEITESNGSSSMATVCGTSLSLMDAGVPVKAPVAGIAMGLIKEGDQFTVLSDILGDEDHLGDMDFKVAGTENGVTALQMDIKIDSITKEIMAKALEQARDGRLHILREMNRVISTPRTEVSVHAPRIVTIKVPKDRIRDVIGKGGATIRALTEETGAVIDIDDEGTVKIAAPEASAIEEAKRRIEDLTSDVEIGRVYEGKVAKLMDFGAFVTVKPGTDGLVHISQIAEERVNNVSDYLKEGQMVKVKVLDVDRQGRIKLSMKEVGKSETEDTTS